MAMLRFEVPEMRKKWCTHCSKLLCTLEGKIAHLKNYEHDFICKNYERKNLCGG